MEKVRFLHSVGGRYRVKQKRVGFIHRDRLPKMQVLGCTVLRMGTVLQYPNQRVMRVESHIWGGLQRVLYRFDTDRFLRNLICLRYNRKPTTSASAHPIGTDHHIPTMPTAGIAERTYASATRLPNEITVKTIETEDLPSPRNNPYSKKSMPIPT